MGKKVAVPLDIDPKSDAGKQLVAKAQTKLRDYLGKDYTDSSLAQYVVVMLAHKTDQAHVAANLEEFLGESDSKEMAAWVFEALLREHTQQAAAPAAPAAPAPAAAGGSTQQAPAQQPQQQGQALAHAVFAPAAGQLAKGPAANQLPATAAAPQAAAKGKAQQQQQHQLRQSQERRGRSKSRSRSRSGRRHKGRSRSRSRSSSYYSGGSSYYSGSSYSRSRSRSRSRRRRRSRSPSYRRGPRRSPGRHEHRLHRSSSRGHHRPRRSPPRSSRNHHGHNHNHHNPHHHMVQLEHGHPPRGSSPHDIRRQHQAPRGGERQGPPPRRDRSPPLGAGARPRPRSRSPQRAAAEQHVQQQQQVLRRQRERERGAEEARAHGVRGRGQPLYGSGAVAEEKEQWREQQQEMAAEPAARRAVWHAEQQQGQQGAAPGGQGVWGRLRGSSRAQPASGDGGNDSWDEGGEPVGGRPWERPSYMDLEREAVARPRGPSLRSTVTIPNATPGGREQQQQQDAGRRVPGGGSTFARALQQATSGAAPAAAAAPAAGAAAAAAAAAGQQQQQRRGAMGATGGGAAAANIGVAVATLRRHVAAAGRQDAAGLRVTVTATEQELADQDEEEAAAAAGIAAPSILARLSRPAGLEGSGPLSPLSPLGSLQSPLSPAAARAGSMGLSLPGAGALAGQGAAGGGQQSSLQSDQEVLRLRMRRMELELTRLRAEREEAERGAQGSAASAARASLALRSVCVTGVPRAATEAILAAHFSYCGGVARVTLLKDPSTGEPSGVAWVQFATQEGAKAALELSGSTLLQRAITVVPKDSPAAKAAAARLQKRAAPIPPAIIPLPVPLLAPQPGAFGGPPKRRRVGGRGKSLVYVRQAS